MENAFRNGKSFSAERPGEGGIVRWVVEAVDEVSDSAELRSREREMTRKEGQRVKIVQVRKDYIRLAETLWNGTEPLAPAPLPDRDIFELLGFD